MTREELITEILRATGIQESILRMKSNKELIDIYEERVLSQGMI